MSCPFQMLLRWHTLCHFAKSTHKLSKKLSSWWIMVRARPMRSWSLQSANDNIQNIHNAQNVQRFNLCDINVLVADSCQKPCYASVPCHRSHHLETATLWTVNTKISFAFLWWFDYTLLADKHMWRARAGNQAGRFSVVHGTTTCD